MNIPYNRSPIMENSMDYISKALHGRLSGDGEFTFKCNRWMEKNLKAPHALLTTSASHALDMSAALINLQPGDEVIMASYNFSSAANSFIAQGARVVFVDIRPDTMNMNEQLLEEAITDKTKVLAPMHYAGVGCEMDYINQLAKEYNLLVVEDAAQGVLSTYNDKYLGTIGDLACYSFHETKNYSMGEGGALLIKDKEHFKQAEIMREKGTNRSRFFRGEVDKYTWVDWGSSFLPSELNAAYLWSQLLQAEEINENRLATWNTYYNAFTPLMEKGLLELPFVPDNCKHNGHIFYIKAKDLDERSRLISHLKNNGIKAVFHYVPLHSAPAGTKFTRFNGEDVYTTKESERLVRLPLYYQIKPEEIHYIIEKVFEFYR